MALEIQVEVLTNGYLIRINDYGKDNSTEVSTYCDSVGSTAAKITEVLSEAK